LGEVHEVGVVVGEDDTVVAAREREDGGVIYPAA